MRPRTLRLLLYASLLYAGILLFARGFLPQDFTPPLSFLVGPLILLVVILLSDLSSRATDPSKTAIETSLGRRPGREVQFLSKQIEVATSASADYFETVLLNRLRDVLVDKVSLETGMERERVKEVLANSSLGARLLRDEFLYRLLYATAPVRGLARVRLLDEAIARIEAWKA